MVFPPDVQGAYSTPERDIGVRIGIKELRSVVAKVTHDTIVFTEIPQVEGSQDVEAYSTNTDSTGYDPGKKGPQKATVSIDSTKHYGATEPPTSIVFTTTDNETFEFDYLVPRYDDEPWTFTKTDETDERILHKPVHVTHTHNGGMDSLLIMLAVVLMVVAAVGVNM